ncbi:MAG: ABC transporter ATP-binding protein [Flavobacteriaceae bacterium]
MSSTILSIKNLNKTYGKFQAIKNLSFTIEKGNVYGILGPNGSGKSTTLGIVLNVVNKSSGEFSWFNNTITTHEALKKVGAIIEHPNFYPYMSAYDNLKLVCEIKGIPASKINEKLTLVGLIERKDSKFKAFSLGMKQRLAIASALLNDPEILILDEPTNGLDPQGIHQIRALITTIAAQGTTILLASHLLDEVEKVCSHVVILRHGEKLYEGRVDELIATKGFFELKSAQKNELMAFLNSNDTFGTIKEDDDKIIAFLNSDIAPEKLNTQLHNKGIQLSHLVKRKESLEHQFLQLTNNN